MPILTSLHGVQQLYQLELPNNVCVGYYGAPDASPLQSRAVAGGLSVGDVLRKVPGGSGTAEIETFQPHLSLPTEYSTAAPYYRNVATRPRASIERSSLTTAIRVGSRIQKHLNPLHCGRLSLRSEPRRRLLIPCRLESYCNRHLSSSLNMTCHKSKMIGSMFY